jgi:general nucleoside transport system permease protein
MSASISTGAATLVAQTLRMMVPYGCAALGGVWSERSGVVNIALEGILLSSGLAAVAAHVATGSAAWGVVAGVVCGASMGAVHALAVRARVDAIVSGIALNIAAAGGTRFLLRALYGSSSNSPSVKGFGTSIFEGTSGALLLARTATDPLLILGGLSTVGTAWLLLRTRFGLHVRACGESPHAAASVGLDVATLRLAAVALGGAICGLGGTALAYDQHQFQSGMSGGRGFIALAAVIVSGWRPGRAVLACAIFAALDAVQILLQGETRVPHDLLQAIPYVATLLALVLMGRRKGSRLGGDGGHARAGGMPPGPPAALGKTVAEV